MSIRTAPTGGSSHAISRKKFSAGLFHQPVSVFEALLRLVCGIDPDLARCLFHFGISRLCRTHRADGAGDIRTCEEEEAFEPIETIRVARDAHRTPRANGSVLTRSDWRNVLSGSNPLALLSQVPGVSYTASDAYGLDESDASLFLRGFHMNELGILFENIPLNETSFGTLNGTNVLNISVPDTIGSIYVSPGTARENLFSNSNNGGEIRYMLLAPTQKHSLSTNQGVGSNNTLVTTLVGQSGQLGANGPKVMAGFQRISKDKYQAQGAST